MTRSSGVMFALLPRFCELILNGEKNVEVRLTWPVQITTPFCAFLYQTKRGTGLGKIVGECTVDRITYADPGFRPSDALLASSGLSKDELENYARGRQLYFLHLSDAKRYEEPKELRSFLCHGLRMRRPPQSFCYVEVA